MIFHFTQPPAATELKHLNIHTNLRMNEGEKKL